MTINTLNFKNTYCDNEAVSCCLKISYWGAEKQLFESLGIILDEEELFQFSNGVKGQDQILGYMNISLRNLNSSYDEVAKELVRRNRRTQATKIIMLCI